MTGLRTSTDKSLEFMDPKVLIPWKREQEPPGKPKDLPTGLERGQGIQSVLTYGCSGEL